MRSYSEIEKTFKHRIFLEKPPLFAQLNRILRKHYPSLVWLQSTERYMEVQRVEGKWTYETESNPIEIHFLKTTAGDADLSIEFPYILWRPTSIFFLGEPSSSGISLLRAMGSHFSRETVYERQFKLPLRGQLTCSAFLVELRQALPDFAWEMPGSYTLVGTNDDGIEITAAPYSLYVLTPRKRPQNFNEIIRMLDTFVKSVEA